MILPVPLSPTFFRLLDLEDGLRASSKPVYGLIFLFRWREDDPDKQEASCPEGLWFANQVCLLICLILISLDLSCKDG